MDDKQNNFKVTLTQLPLDKRVKKILFRYTDCRLKTCMQMSSKVIYTKFNMIFLDKELKPLSGMKMIGEYADLESIKRLKNIQIKFEEERTQEFVLEDNELIVGMDIGLDVNGNVNNFKFILA